MPPEHRIWPCKAMFWSNSGNTRVLCGNGEKVLFDDGVMVTFQARIAFSDDTNTVKHVTKSSHAIYILFQAWYRNIISLKPDKSYRNYQNIPLELISHWYFLSFGFMSVHNNESRPYRENISLHRLQPVVEVWVILMTVIHVHVLHA